MQGDRNEKYLLLITILVSYYNQEVANASAYLDKVLLHSAGVSDSEILLQFDVITIGDKPDYGE